MADRRVGNLRQMFRRLRDIGIGAALAFTLTVATTLAFPDGVDRVLWVAVLAFTLLIVCTAWLLTRRLARVEVEVRQANKTGEKLRGEIARRERAEADLLAEELFPYYNPGPTLRFDRKGQVNKYNPAAVEQIGTEKLADKLLTELVPGMIAGDVHRCISEGRIAPREVQWGDRWFVCHFRGVADMDVGMVYASDITAIKQAELELRDTEDRTRAILDGAAEAIFIVIDGGVIQAMNPATERLFGWKQDELVGRNVDVLLPELFEGRQDDRLKILMEASATQPAGSVECIYNGRTRTGESIPVSVTVSVYEVAGAKRCSCFVRDVSERIRAERMTREQASKLAEQNRKLEQLVTELNEFNYVASHDLQEPLRTMSTYCGLLQKDLGDSPPARVTEDLAAILDASLRMQRLITSLLEYSRSGNVELNLAPVDLGAVMHRVKRDLRARIDETGGTVEGNGLPMVHADDMQIGRVFQNLVANGLKFHRDGVPPSVRISAEEDGSVVRVAVQDNGIGIDGAYLPQVFQPFKRVHGEGKYEGSGIGLSICRKIVERHGGRIEVETDPGTGSRFVVVLPHKERE
jgi:PAS domain S-box-containing protein